MHDIDNNDKNNNDHNNKNNNNDKNNNDDKNEYQNEDAVYRLWDRQIIYKISIIKD
jgi:hypothetical protein